MRIKIKTKWFEIYSDTTRHQLLVTIYFTFLLMQLYAWSMHIDSLVWSTTSTIALAIVAYATRFEFLIRQKIQEERKRKVVTVQDTQT